MVRAAALILVLGLLWAGCDDGGLEETTVLTVVATTTSTAAVATTTTATTTTATSPWDVVALGASYVAGVGLGPNGSADPSKAFPSIYAQSLGEQLGIEVALHPYVDMGTVAQWNRRLALSRRMRDQLGQAEVVIVWVGDHNILNALSRQSCGTDWPEPLRTCLQEATETMPEDFGQLLGTIEDLVPEGAVVMIGNQGVAPSLVAEWGSRPYWPELKAVAFDGWWQGIETAAAAHGAIVVDSAEALNGPDGNQVLHPEFSQPDRLHMNPSGHQFLADLFLAADGLGA